jgi:hypothetical protein
MTSIGLDLQSLRSLGSEPVFANIIEASRHRLDLQFASLNRRNTISQTLFPEVQNSVIRLLQQFPDSPERQAAIQKVRGINMSISHCSSRDGILSPNAFYNQERNHITLCNSLLFRTDSLFSIALVLGHEIAHSIDPCNPRHGVGRLFDGISRCLARPRAGHMNPECSSTYQLGELFCDWMGSHVLADLQATSSSFSGINSDQFALGMANTLPFCEYTSPNELRSQRVDYPIMRDRLNTIVTHPGIRQRMGCANNGQLAYCPPQGVGPEGNAPPSTSPTRSVQ